MQHWENTQRALPVHIKVRSINFNSSWAPLNTWGNDLTVVKFLPMTNDWSLYVGNTFTTDGAALAVKAIENGNVGIGTANPTEKLSVNGSIRAREIKVEAAGWADYVFEEGYKIWSLESLEDFIKKNKHLPEIPNETEVKAGGIALGDMNVKLLKKIEELTLYLIEQNKLNVEQFKKIEEQNKRIAILESRFKR